MASRLPAAYRARVLGFWQELGISPRLVKARKLPVYVEAQRLQPIGLGTDGRDKLLVPGAAAAWAAMRMVDCSRSSKIAAPRGRMVKAKNVAINADRKANQRDE